MAKTRTNRRTYLVERNPPDSDAWQQLGKTYTTYGETKKGLAAIKVPGTYRVACHWPPVMVKEETRIVHAVAEPAVPAQHDVEAT